MWSLHSIDCDAVDAVEEKRRQKVVDGKKYKNMVCQNLGTVDVYSIDVSKPIPPAVEKMISHVIAIKMGESDYNIIQFKSGGPQPLTLTLITVARKESRAVTKRIYYDQEQPIPKKFCK